MNLFFKPVTEQRRAVREARNVMGKALHVLRFIASKIT